MNLIQTCDNEVYYMNSGFSKSGTGMILGKFLPPHRGHQYLIDFGLQYVETLIVIVGTLKSEPIPGRIRFEWIREAFPRADVRHLEDENPQEPHEHPDFWQIWYDSLRRIVPTGPDFIFASESYGVKLADILGATYIPVDHARELVPISGTRIRENPLANWSYLLPNTRSYFVRKVCIFGPESTGKSILAQRLASHYQTVHVHEYARSILQLKDNRVDREDFPFIARGQLAAEEAMTRQANRVLFCQSRSSKGSVASHISRPSGIGSLTSGISRVGKRIRWGIALSR
jgi:HTH-type transcriptional regulator, transcriptional repressor of NAD biosynthesis genes